MILMILIKGKARQSDRYLVSITINYALLALDFPYYRVYMYLVYRRLRLQGSEEKVSPCIRSMSLHKYLVETGI